MRFTRPPAFGGPVVDLPKFAGRLNVLAAWRRRAKAKAAWFRYVQTQRLRALSRAALTSRWHPDAYRQPGEPR